MMDLTPAQFEVAVGAPAKWIQNTRRILGRPASLDRREALWFSIVHELNRSVGMLLKQAAKCADIVLAAHPAQRQVTIDFDEAKSVALVIDVHRSITLHLARLSRAIEMPPAERRGRPKTKQVRVDPVERAIEYGIDTMLLRAGRGMAVTERLQRLDDNLAFLQAARANLEVSR